MTTATSRLTDLRNGILRAIDEIPLPEGGLYRVQTGPTRFGEQTGVDDQVFTVIAILGPATDQHEEWLDDLLDSSGPLSVKTAIETDRHLRGALDLRVASTSGVRAYPQAEGEAHIGAEWKVQAMLDQEAI